MIPGKGVKFLLRYIRKWPTYPRSERQIIDTRKLNRFYYLGKPQLKLEEKIDLFPISELIKISKLSNLTG
jgi:hypothetical protein